MTLVVVKGWDAEVGWRAKATDFIKFTTFWVSAVRNHVLQVKEFPKYLNIIFTLGKAAQFIKDL